MKIDISADVSKVEKYLRGMRDKLPVTIQSGLNKTAYQMSQELKRDLPKYIDRPTAFTLRGIQYQKATKQNLTAVIGFAGDGFGKLRNPGIEPSEYMKRLILGESRKTVSGQRAFLVPSSHQKLNSSGNLSRANRKTGKRASGSRFFIASGRDNKTKHLEPGLYRRRGNGRARIEAMVLYKTETKRYPKKLAFETLMNALFRSIAPGKFNEAIRETMMRSR